MINRGIDDQISQRIMASGGNPQKLMQDYSRKKELLDLLALQRLKKQKEDTMRDMQLSLQNNPQTIKQQREAQVAELTKNELAQQVGQTMAQQQARSQQNVQRVAQAGLPNAPAPNMRMQNGGIVGFAGPTGSQVQGQFTPMLQRSGNPNIYGSAHERIKQMFTGDDSPTEAELKVLGYSKADFEALTYGQKAQVLLRIDRQREYLSEQVEDTPSNIPVLSGRRAIEAEMERRKKVGDTFVPDARTDYSLEETTAPMPTDDLDQKRDRSETSSQFLPESSVPSTYDASVQPEQKPSPESEPEQKSEPNPFANVGITADKVGIPTARPELKAEDYEPNLPSLDPFKTQYKDIQNVDVEQKGEDAFDRVQNRLGDTEEEKAGIKALIDERRKIEQGLLDPEKLRTQQILSQLSGMAGSSTAGIAGARGTQASLQAQRAQEQAQQDLFEKRKADFDEVLDRSRAVKEKGSAAEESTITAEQARSDAALGKQLDITNKEREAAQKTADRLLSVDQANLTAADRQRALELQAALKVADQQFTLGIKTIEGNLAQEKNEITRLGYEAKSITAKQQVQQQILASIGKIESAYTKLFVEAREKATLLGGSPEEKAARLQALSEQQNEAIEQSTKELQTLNRQLQQEISGFSAPVRKP